MEQYVGRDVSLEQTSICVVDGSGKTLWQGKCPSTPEAIAAAIRARAPEVARIGLESGPLSAWHWHELRKPLQEVAEALLPAWQAIHGQISTLSRRLVIIARQDKAVKRLMTAPGVGVLVALTYASVIDDPERFAKSSSVGAYVGLTPSLLRSVCEAAGG